MDLLGNSSPLLLLLQVFGGELSCNWRETRCTEVLHLSNRLVQKANRLLAAWRAEVTVNWQ